MLRVTSALRARLQQRPGPWTVAYLVAALVSLVPFAPGLARGECLYFRDLSSHFFPIRRFVVEGLRAGALREWNPYVNEGLPLLLPPVAYPLDLLQTLLPGEWGFSLLLALHVPLAALTLLGLARRLGYSPAPATLAALVYALSGFSLSCVNLYILMPAFAWAPLVISRLMAARSGGARQLAVAGAAVALCLSTTGLEIAAQAIACGFVLAASRRISQLLRVAASVLLGVLIAAAPLAAVFSLYSGSRRQGGFRVAESLDQSVHPASLLQTLIVGLYGDPIAAGYDYWGARFWGGPSPYFLSLYLGGVALCLVAIGAARAERYRARLLLLLAAGLLVCLGRFARLDLLLEVAPFLTRFRFPVKAFFTVVVAASLLAGAGATWLASSRRRWGGFAAMTLAVGLGLVCLPMLETLLPGQFGWLQSQVFVEAYPRELRALALRSVAADAAAGATALLAAAVLAGLCLRQRLSPQAAVVAVTAILAADLLRAGVALNPTTPASLYTLSPEMSRVAARLRESGARVFTCSIYAMPTFREAVRLVGHTGVWATAVWRETLSPHTNLDVAIPTTGPDATAVIPSQRALTTGDVMCSDPGAPQRLREAGVRYILSVQPFTNEALRLVDVASPQRTHPLSIYVYELDHSLSDPAVWTSPDDLDPLGRGRSLEGARARYVEAEADHVRVAVETPRAAYLILRRNGGVGWQATLNGRPVPIVAANGRHQAVAIPVGSSEVALSYQTPKRWVGPALTLAAAALAALLYRRGPRAEVGGRATTGP